MVIIVNLINFEFQLLGECHSWWTKESPMAHVTKFYGRFWLIHSVLRASNFPCEKFIAIVIHGFITPSCLALPSFGTFTKNVGITFHLFKRHCLAKDH